MKRTIVALCSGAFILAAKNPAPNSDVKLQPYQATALLNALRGSKIQGANQLPGHLKLRDLKLQAVPTLMARAKLQTSGVDCAIPLLEARADRSLDKKMKVPINRDSSLSDAMPKLKGLPACRDRQ